jgi:hypothetical protein
MRIDLLTVKEKERSHLVLVRKRGDLTINVHLPNDYVQNYKIDQIVSFDVYQVSGSKYVLRRDVSVHKHGYIELLFSNSCNINYDSCYYFEDSGRTVVLLDHLKHFKKGDNIKIKIS